MHKYVQHIRFSFKDDQGSVYYSEPQPIGGDVTEQDIKRSEKSDSLVLNNVQNVSFIKSAKDYLVNYRQTKGLTATLEIVKEIKHNNDWKKNSSGYASMITLKTTKNTATIDYRDTAFDEVFRNNIREQFELDRDTDINGNSISALETVQMSWKAAEIFLRTDLRVKTPYSVDSSLPGPSTRVLAITPTMQKVSSSDNEAVPVILQDYDAVASSASVANLFHFNASRPKDLKLFIDVNISVTHDNPVNMQLLLVKHSGTGPLTPVSSTVLVADSTTDLLTYSVDNYEVFVDTGEGLELVCLVTYNETTITYNVSQCVIIQEEDSNFEPENPEETLVDAITMFNAFKRVTEILDPSVVFKSDFLENSWPNLLTTSGERIRHVLYDEQNAPITKTSFKRLYDALFTIAPVGYGIRVKGSKTILEVEDIEYFRDQEEAIYLGTLTDIERSINEKKVFTGVEVGYSKSGENEEVHGLQATHTVNKFTLPIDTHDNIYQAVCDYVSDPVEAELQYRKQYSIFPDEDFKRDKDNFLFDCKLVNNVYTPRERSDDFTQVTGIYRPDSKYNYRLSPMNCLRRHGKNFKQEYGSAAYSGESIRYTSTDGNVALKTELIGGSLIGENDDILLSDLEDATFTAEIITGKAATNFEIEQQINGGLDKPNYLKTAIFINEVGEEEKTIINSLKIGETIKAELAIR
jgi:hypothetical protein